MTTVLIRRPSSGPDYVARFILTVILIILPLTFILNNIFGRNRTPIDSTSAVQPPMDIANSPKIIVVLTRLPELSNVVSTILAAYISIFSILLTSAILLTYLSHAHLDSLRSYLPYTLVDMIEYVRESVHTAFKADHFVFKTGGYNTIIVHSSPIDTYFPQVALFAFICLPIYTSLLMSSIISLERRLLICMFDCFLSLLFLPFLLLFLVYSLIGHMLKLLGIKMDKIHNFLTQVVKHVAEIIDQVHRFFGVSESFCLSSVKYFEDQISVIP